MMLLKPPSLNAHLLPAPDNPDDADDEYLTPNLNRFERINSIDLSLTTGSLPSVTTVKFT